MVATTLPTVAPRPKCASAMRQTGPARIGRREVRNACSRALSSSSLAHEVRFGLICFGICSLPVSVGHSDNQIVRQIGSSDRPECSRGGRAWKIPVSGSSSKLERLPFRYSHVFQPSGWPERAGGECRTLALPRTKRALSHPSITGEVPPTRFERAHAGFGPAASSVWATGARWLGPRVLTPTRMVHKTVLGDRPGPSRSAPY